MRRGVFLPGTLFLLLAAQTPASGIRAAEQFDNFSAAGVLAGVSQREECSDPKGNHFDQRGGSGPFQLELGFTPWESDEFSVKLGFAAGNGVHDSRFNLASWAADMEDDVTNINGRARDHMLTAWYKHTFGFGSSHSLGLTGGIIDATDYLDQNVYANDEYTQFMNEALVNGPNSFAPSYDIGGALGWQIGRIFLNGVIMEVGENDDGNTFQFYGTQLNYRIDTWTGEGNYRVILEGTDNTFLDPTETALAARRLLLFSFDQQFGRTLGAWTRFGWQDKEAAVTYGGIYSGGINISGTLWHRATDEIGLGYAYLQGGNLRLESTQVFESYVRFALSETLAITGDIQYMNDAYKTERSHGGFVYGIRVAAVF